VIRIVAPEKFTLTINPPTPSRLTLRVARESWFVHRRSCSRTVALGVARAQGLCSSGLELRVELSTMAKTLQGKKRACRGATETFLAHFCRDAIHRRGAIALMEH
jgi:hypothetical protein